MPSFDFLADGLVANRHGFVASGTVVGPFTEGTLDGVFNLGLAFSADGINWTSLPLEGDRRNSIASASAASEDRFVIAGSQLPEAGVWVSDDGTTWSFHSLGAGEESVQEIAAGRQGFLVTGQEESPVGPAAAWFSPDGLTWTKVSAPGIEDLISLTGFGDGFVAIGSQRDTLTYQRTSYSVWRTIDGREWEQLGSFPDQVCCSPSDVAAHGDLAVAVGAGDCDGGLIGAAWHLTGEPPSWKRVIHSAALESSYLWSVTAADEGFVAVGTQGAEFNASRVGIWTSSDGTTWTLRSLLTDEGAWITEGPVVGGAGLLVMGSSSNFDPADPFAMPRTETVTWLLPTGGSLGDELIGDIPAVSPGCDRPRVGTGLPASVLESDLSTNVPLSFESVEINGMPARKGTNASQTVEVVLIGDTTDIERIEVRGRDTEFEAGAAIFALEWLWLDDDALQNAMFELAEGNRDHVDAVVGDLAVTADRLTVDEWEYQIVIVPAR